MRIARSFIGAVAMVAAAGMTAGLGAGSAFAAQAENGVNPRPAATPTPPPPPACPTQTTTPAAAPTWMIAPKALSLLVQNNDATATVKSYLNTRETYVFAPSGQWLNSTPGASSWPIPSAFSSATPAAYYIDENQLATDLNNATTLAALKNDGIHTVVLDLENWPSPPPEQQQEQQNPLHYYSIGAALAKSKGMKLFATPATNLAEAPNTKLTSKNGQPHYGNDYADFYDDDVLGQIASYPGVSLLDIQAQQSEGPGANGTPSHFCPYVQEETKQVRAVTATTPVIAGIATQPLNSGPIAVSDILTSVRAVRDMVGGFWLNDPEHLPDVTRQILEGMDQAPSPIWPPTP
jgi:hypothetical protein